MATNTLLTWIGATDLRAARGELPDGVGPIAQAVSDRSFSRIYLLSNYARQEEERFADWLRKRTDAAVSIRHFDLTGPTDYREVYEAAVSVATAVHGELKDPNLGITYHLSPGTPAMAAVWIILARTSHPAELIESSQKHGVGTVSFPFDLAADYLPEAVQASDDDIIRLTQGLPPDRGEFDAIIHRCAPMKRLIAKASPARGRSCSRVPSMHPVLARTALSFL